MTLYADLTDERRVRYVDGVALYKAKDESGGTWWVAADGSGSAYARTAKAALETHHHHYPQA